MNNFTVLSVLAVAKSGVFSKAHRVDTGLPLCASHRREGAIGSRLSSSLFTVAEFLKKGKVRVEETEAKSARTRRVMKYSKSTTYRIALREKCTLRKWHTIVANIATRLLRAIVAKRLGPLKSAKRQPNAQPASLHSVDVSIMLEKAGATQRTCPPPTQTKPEEDSTSAPSGDAYSLPALPSPAVACGVALPP